MPRIISLSLLPPLYVFKEVILMFGGLTRSNQCSLDSFDPMSRKWVHLRTLPFHARRPHNSGVAVSGEHTGIDYWVGFQGSRVILIFHPFPHHRLISICYWRAKKQ